ncbi:MAG: hypothetical protein GX130_06755 [Candidatus Hydrogenedens sp.]|nr:hypothetical protein [Candidatus Hydrogenedens sp.]
MRLYGLTSQGLWYDEACSIFLSDYAAHWNELFNVDYNNDPPLFLLILLGWRHLLSFMRDVFSTDWFLRFLPCFFSVLTVPAVYGATKALFTYRPSAEEPSAVSPSIENTALCASFLMALSPFHRFYAQELRGYSLLTLLAVLVLWAFIQALQHNRIRHWLLLSLLLSLSFWTHFFAAWFFMVLNLYLLLTFPIHKKRYLPWAISHIIAGLLCLPALYYAWQVSRIVNAFSVQWIPAPDLKTLFITYKTFFAGYSPRALFYWPLFLLAGLLTISGLWSLRRHCHFFLLLFLWTGCAMAISAIIWYYRDFSYYEHRLFVWSSFSAAIIVARGWAVLKPRLQQLSGIVFILLSLPLLYDSTVHAVHPVPQHRLGVRYKADSRGAASCLAREAFAGEAVYHASHVTLPPLRFYLPAHPQIHLCRTPEELEGFYSAYPNEALWAHLNFQPYLWSELTEKPATFWWVRSWWEPFDIPDQVFELEKEISAAYEPTAERVFFGITLIRFERKPSAPSEQMSDEPWP